MVTTAETKRARKLAQMKAWHVRHREAHCQQQKAWRMANEEHCRVQSLVHYHRSARRIKQGAAFVAQVRLLNLRISLSTRGYPVESNGAVYNRSEHPSALRSGPLAGEAISDTKRARKLARRRKDLAALIAGNVAFSKLFAKYLSPSPRSINKTKRGYTQHIPRELERDDLASPGLVDDFTPVVEEARLGVVSRGVRLPIRFGVECWETLQFAIQPQ